VSPVREDDRTLVARANAGDAAAFTALYRGHREWVFGLALRFTGNRDDALDVVQESFGTLFGKFPGFALATSIRAFLYPVVRHTAISLLRKRRKIVPLDADALRAEEPPLGWSSGSVSELDRMIAKLPEEQRDVVRMRFGLDLKLEEIAAALGVPSGTVKSRLHNALKALRERAG
jgi:RNA polymerase sigma-70 factor (ECF subfamily)